MEELIRLRPGRGVLSNPSGAKIHHSFGDDPENLKRGVPFFEKGFALSVCRGFPSNVEQRTQFSDTKLLPRFVEALLSICFLTIQALVSLSHFENVREKLVSYGIGMRINPLKEVR